MNENKFLIYPEEGQPPISSIVTNRIIEYSRELKKSGSYKPWIRIKQAKVCSVGSKTQNEDSVYAHETVMTTDKVVEYSDDNGEIHRSPVALKIIKDNDKYSSNETRHENIANKLEIERIYWKQNNRVQRIVTQNKPYFAINFVKNLKRAEQEIDIDIASTLKAEIKERLLELVPKTRSYPLGVIEDEIAQLTNQKVSLIHECIFHLLWHQELLWDLHKEIAIHKRIPLKKGAKICVWQ